MDDETKANSRHALDNGHKTTHNSSPQEKLGLDDKPTMPLLLYFPGGEDGSIRIPDRIGDNYYDFGIFLLDDKNGSKIKALRGMYQSNYNHIIRDIFTTWLEGSGTKPITWGTFIQVLKNVGLVPLAEEVEKTCKASSDTSSLSQGEAVVGLKRKAPEHEAATGLESPKKKVKIDTDLLVEVCELRSKLNALESRKKELKHKKMTAVKEVSQLALYPGCLPHSAPGYEAISQLPNVNQHHLSGSGKQTVLLNIRVWSRLSSELKDKLYQSQIIRT